MDVASCGLQVAHEKAPANELTPEIWTSIFGGFSMSKYSVAFKQTVVAFHLGGDHSYRDTGVHYGLDHSQVRKWVYLHTAHGFDGLSRKISSYTAEFRLSVLRRMWKDGLSFRQTAAVFNIRNDGCLSDWERRYERGGIEALVSRRKGRPRSMPEPPTPSEPNASPSDDTRSREELLAELSHLRMENAYLKKLKALTQEQLPLKKRKPFRR